MTSGKRTEVESNERNEKNQKRESTIGEIPGAILGGALKDGTIGGKTAERENVVRHPIP